MGTWRLEAGKLPAEGQRSWVHRDDGQSVALFNVKGQLHAIDDRCPHAGASLCTGKLDGHLLTCPAHGLRFDLRTGAMVGNPLMRVTVFTVRKDGDAYLLEPSNHSTN